MNEMRKMIQELWRQLETELGNLSPDLLSQLHPSADEAMIFQAEDFLGVALPEEVKSFFRRHNGSVGPLFGHWTLLSLEEACQEWVRWKTRSSQVSIAEKRQWIFYWDPLWLPLARAEPDGPFLLLNIGNIEMTRQGCILQQNFDEIGKNRERLRFYSLQILFRTTLEDLQTDGYRYDAKKKRLRAVKYYLAFDRTGDMDDDPWDEMLGEQPGRMNYPGLACLSFVRSYAEQRNSRSVYSIEESWERIALALAQQAPAISQDFKQYPHEHPLHEIEQTLQVQFPHELKTWYTRFNYGRQKGNGFLDWFDWCVLEDVYIQWDLKREGTPDPAEPIPFPYPKSYLLSADSRIQALQWHPHWIPFMYHIDGMFYCVDLAPTQQGHYGQVILPIQWGWPYKNHELNIWQIPPTLWVAPSLSQFLTLLAQDLEAGRYAYDPSSQMLWSQEGLAYIEEDETMSEWLADHRNKIEEERNPQERWE